MSRFAFRLPLSVITERGPGGEVNTRSLIGFTITEICTYFAASVQYTLAYHFKAQVFATNPECAQVLLSYMTAAGFTPSLIAQRLNRVQ